MYVENIKNPTLNQIATRRSTGNTEQWNGSKWIVIAHYQAPKRQMRIRCLG